MEEPGAGRRERSKSRTRARIREAALELFAQRGFAQTTVADIAERADVAPRTFFRYYESKEDLLLPDLQGLFAAVTAEVRTRLPRAPPLDAIRDAVIAVVRVHPAAGALPVASADGPPFPPGAGLRIMRAFVAWEEQLTAALAAHAGAAADDGDAALWARTVALVGVGAVRAAWRTTGGVRNGEAAFVAAIERTFATAAAGCPPPPG